MIKILLEAFYYFLMIISFLIIASAILSWFPSQGFRKVHRVLRTLIEPILSPIRKMIQKSIFGGNHMTIDFSPFIAYLIISTLQRYIALFLIQS